MSTFWVASAATVPPLELGFVVLAFAVGLPLALVAASVPAMEAAQLTPIAAVRGEGDLETRERLPRRYVVTPLLLFGLAGGLATRGPVNGLPVFGLLASLAVVFGAAFLVPALLYGLQSKGGSWTKWLRVEGELARANLGGAIRRLSISVAALAVSLAMMVAIAIMIGSFRETVIYWVGQTLQADLFVATARQTPVGERVGMSAAVEETITAHHPAVVAVDGFYGVDVPYGESLVIVGSGRFEVLLAHGNLLFKAPADGRGAMAAAIGEDAALVSESFSLKYGVDVGDLIDLPTPHGPAPVRVAAVYYDYSNDRGLIVVDHATFTRHFGEHRPAGLTLYLSDAADPVAVRDELVATLGPDRPVFINTNASLRREVLRVFDSTFAITYAMEAIAIFVSMLGVAATLLTLVLERRQEIAMLRLVGAERTHLRRMIIVEAGLLGVVSLGTGLVVGLVLSLVLIYVINVQSFGWTIQFHLPVVFLAQTSLLILVATTLSGLYPARLAGRFRMGDLSADA